MGAGRGSSIVVTTRPEVAIHNSVWQVTTTLDPNNPDKRESYTWRTEVHNGLCIGSATRLTFTQVDFPSSKTSLFLEIAPRLCPTISDQNTDRLTLRNELLIRTPFLEGLSETIAASFLRHDISTRMIVGAYFNGAKSTLEGGGLVGFGLQAHQRFFIDLLLVGGQRTGNLPTKTVGGLFNVGGRF